MKRTPIKETTLTPDCLGVSFNAVDKLCKACPHAGRCELICLRWRPRLSLTERVKQIEEKLTAPSTASFRDTYSEAYLKHYGKRCPPRIFQTRQYLLASVKTEQLCKDEGLDLAVWITAQMHGMAKFISAGNGRVKTFMPNMLCGPKARIRYNVFVRYSGKFYGRSKADAFESNTASEKLIRLLVSAEEEIGSVIAASYVNGAPLSLDAAKARCVIDEVWLAAHDHVGRIKLESQYDKNFLTVAVELARARAAVQVVSRYGADLADRIGYAAPLCWSGVGEVLARVVGARAVREKVHLANETENKREGGLWRGA